MKNDHRVTLTKKMIADSFFSLLREKPVGKMTVKELCEGAGINRATFYSHYDDIFELEEELRDEFAGSIIAAVMSHRNGDSLEEMISSVCRCICDNKESCEIVFGKNAEQNFVQDAVELFRGRYISLWGDCTSADERELDLLFTYMSNGAFAVIRGWVQSGFECPPEYIAAFLAKNVKLR